MKSREEKFQAILLLARSLEASGKTKTFLEVATFLNKNGYRNNAGKPYAASPRGIAKVIAAAWEYAADRFGEKKALPIANSFTGASGDYAWTE
jgi:hypothetical protein